MKVNWNKIVGSVLLASSVMENTSGTVAKIAGMNSYNSTGLEKTFEVRENINYHNFVENSASKLGETGIVVVDQKSLDSYGSIKPVKQVDPICLAECADEWTERAALCAVIFSGNLIAIGICEAGAFAAYLICADSC